MPNTKEEVEKKYSKKAKKILTDKKYREKTKKVMEIMEGKRVAHSRHVGSIVHRD